MDEDLEEPTDFDGVIFVIGEFESSILPVVDFVELLELACLEYVKRVPDDENRIFSNQDRVKEKYLSLNG